MAIQISSALRRHINMFGSYKSALQGGIIDVYSGSQPANADAAATGTKLFTLTNNALAFTAEVQASGTITVTGSAGSIDAVTVNSVAVLDTAVPFNTSAAQTAADLAAAINATNSSPEYRADVSGAVVTIRPMPGVGAGANTFAIATTLSGGMTTTNVALSGGSNPSNGLLLTESVSGVLSKRASQVWAGNSLATGTAGWFRMRGTVADAGALDSSGVLIRLDGSVASAGGNATMSNPTITGVGVSQTVNSFALTLPSSI